MPCIISADIGGLLYRTDSLSCRHGIIMSTTYMTRTDLPRTSVVEYVNGSYFNITHVEPVPPSRPLGCPVSPA